MLPSYPRDHHYIAIAGKIHCMSHRFTSGGKESQQNNIKGILRSQLIEDDQAVEDDRNAPSG